jgi:hypothetical protein
MLSKSIRFYHGISSHTNRTTFFGACELGAEDPSERVVNDDYWRTFWRPRCKMDQATRFKRKCFKLLTQIQMACYLWAWSWCRDGGIRLVMRLFMIATNPYLWLFIVIPIAFLEVVTIGSGLLRDSHWPSWGMHILLAIRLKTRHLLSRTVWKVPIWGF